MLPDRVSNPGPLTYESGALPIALHGPAAYTYRSIHMQQIHCLIYAPVIRAVGKWEYLRIIFLISHRNLML